MDNDVIQPIWGKMGEWVMYKQDNLFKELEDTKKRLAEAQAELAAMKSKSYPGTKVNGIKACAEVTFIPKTS